MIGHFLGSADGYIHNDAIKVGVEMSIWGNFVLIDLRLSHAELAHYKDVDVIPVDVTYRSINEDLAVYLHGRRVYFERHILSFNK